MIDSHQVMNIKPLGIGKVELEVNYSEKELVKKCQVIKLRVNKEEVEIKRDDLVNILLMIGTESDQKKLMPMQLTKIRKLERMLTFELQLKYDHKKGDKITVQAPWIDEIPETEEIFAGNIAKKRSPILDKSGKKASWKKGFVSGI